MINHYYDWPARAEGLEIGWVSMFDPAELGKLLQIPGDAKPVAI